MKEKVGRRGKACIGESARPIFGQRIALIWRHMGADYLLCKDRIVLHGKLICKHSFIICGPRMLIQTLLLQNVPSYELIYISKAP